VCLTLSRFFFFVSHLLEARSRFRSYFLLMRAKILFCSLFWIRVLSLSLSLSLSVSVCLCLSLSLSLSQLIIPAIAFQTENNRFLI
jgi:hypothetical protein